MQETVAKKNLRAKRDFHMEGPQVGLRVLHAKEVLHTEGLRMALLVERREEQILRAKGAIHVEGSRLEQKEYLRYELAAIGTTKQTEAGRCERVPDQAAEEMEPPGPQWAS